MAYNPNLPPGQAAPGASAPVVLASSITPPFSLAEATTGGATVKKFISPTNATPVEVKGSAGKVTGWYIYNSAGTVRVLRFFNTTLTPGTAVNPYLTIPIPPLSAANCPFPAGIDFPNGIWIAVTTNLEDATVTAPNVANELIINIFYK